MPTKNKADRTNHSESDSSNAKSIAKEAKAQQATDESSTPADRGRRRDDCIYKVMPDGEVICIEISRLSGGAAELRALLNKFFSGQEGWGENKQKLFYALFKALAASDLPDDHIPNRRKEIVSSVTALLDTDPPALIPYPYSCLPLDILLLYYSHKEKHRSARAILKAFEGPPKKP